MDSSKRLGGFKILKGLTKIALVSPGSAGGFPTGFFQIIAKEKINLPFLTCIRDDNLWGLNIMAEAPHGTKIAALIDEISGTAFTPASNCAILSVFPHKSDPAITGKLMEVLGQKGMDLDGLAYSPSAVSVVLKEELLARASDALFEPFSFSAYRTPADWKLAQEGKEELYKEVVASYQEQRPKVYGLECQDRQELLRVTLDNHDMGGIGSALTEFARLGLHLAFLATNPCSEDAKTGLTFCLPIRENQSYPQIINGISPDLDVAGESPVAAFTMNGPHFGDRYGIASELLTAFAENDVDLLGLSCTIASITGVVPSSQLDKTIHAIQQRFEVPSVTRKGV